jgi:predicted nucleic acid-binding protein
VKPTDSSFVRRLIRLAAEGERKPLHAAEAEALALATELKGMVISDDHVARSTAKLVQAELHGTGYPIGRMYREGHVSKEEAKAKVREMRREGWRLSEDDYRNILDYLETL